MTDPKERDQQNPLPQPINPVDPPLQLPVIEPDDFTELEEGVNQE